MTENEWRAATDPKPMLNLLNNQVSDRKLRLFAVALARQFWDRIAEPAHREAIELAVRASDGGVDAEVMTAAARRADRLIATWQAEMGVATPLAWIQAATPEARSLHVWVVLTVVPGTMRWLRDPDLLLYKMASEVTRLQQPPLLKEVFGNPFRAAAVEPSWLTSDAVAIARQMYDSRDFSPMPILADALQDAGCDNDDILDHCRQPGEHVRGCWVVDLLTGRK